MTVSELPEGATLLDVREAEEWAAGHAPGALHIPMGEVSGRLAELPGDGDLYVVCRSGVRSAHVTAHLNSVGWKAMNVEGGMQSWQALGRPMVGELPGSEPQVI